MHRKLVVIDDKLAYTGSIAFIVNKQLVKDIPRSWADLKTGTYKVSAGDVSTAAQAVNGVLAAAIAMGGNVRVGFEDNIYLGKGQKAASNGELVAKVVRIAKELGREIANPGEARRILSLA